MKKKCNINIPRSLYPISCVNPYMGGHSRIIINHLENNHVNCAKKLNREIYFYKNMDIAIKAGYWPGLGYFLPKLKGICNHKGGDYMIIENIFEKFGGSEYRYLDIKLGYHTSFSGEAGAFKNLRHKVLDSKTNSKKYGFRVEGGNITGLTKFAKQNINPLDMWRWFFNKTPRGVINMFIDRLTILVRILYYNTLSKNIKFGSVGTSILIAHNNKDIVVKLIDFTHGYITITPNKLIDRMAENNYNGLVSLINTLSSITFDE